MKIFLIGLPGSGKSTLGKELAEELNIRFIDLDAEIEADCNAKIADVFKANGENYFRERESKVLTRIIGDRSDFVMATGGGAPCFHNGIDIMNLAGITIFLDVPVETIRKRMNEAEKKVRPLLDSNEKDVLDRLLNLHKQRLQFYQKATFTCSAESISVNDLMSKI